MVKAYFILRKELGMSRSKLSVQVGHGTDFIHENKKHNPFFEGWLNENEGNRRKIVLEIKSKEKLINIINLLRQKNIPFQKIYDAGYTEFDGKTLTGIVIYPIEESMLPDRIHRIRVYV